MRIACLGGGPGGLLAALLAKRSHPGREVTVFERNRAGDTFGFGVVFSDATLDGIDAADPVLRRALDGHGVHWDPIEVRLRGERWRFGGNGMAAVARQALLSRPGTVTRPSRTSASSVWQVFDGAGSVRLNHDEQPLERGDIVGVPAWTEFSLTAEARLDLFTFSDAPVFEKLNLLRTEVS